MSRQRSQRLSPWSARPGAPLGIRRGRRVQAAVEAHHAGDAAGRFYHHGAAETVADGPIAGPFLTYRLVAMVWVTLASKSWEIPLPIYQPTC